MRKGEEGRFRWGTNAYPKGEVVHPTATSDTKRHRTSQCAKVDGILRVCTEQRM